VILDSSAVVAVLLGEPDHDWLVRRIGPAPVIGIGAPTLAETAIVLQARLGDQGRTLLSRFAEEAELTSVPFGEPHWRAAADAFRRFGKGRHRAALNFGDCMSYATARVAGDRLLCVGDDFAKTDLSLVDR